MATIHPDIDAVHRRIDREVQNIQSHTEARLRETRDSIDRETDLKLENIKLEIRNTINGFFWKLVGAIGGIIAVVLLAKEILVFIFKGASGIP